jgi:3-oxoacyl-[acyl-carrier-protein] synthase II
MSTRIAVTGLGAVTPVGDTADTTWHALASGRSGVTRIAADWADELPVRVAGLVDADLSQKLSVREIRRMDRAEQLAVVAGREAWSDAGLNDASNAPDPDRVGVVVGTAVGGLHTTLEQQHVLEQRGQRRMSPHTMTMMMANGPAAFLSIAIKARAGARSPVSACASSSEALVIAREMILAGTADIVVAGGAEACVTGLTLGGLAQTRALSPHSDRDPAGASRPFDADRDGFVLAEGSALLVLEREEHARARGARILGYLAGGAVTSDALDIVAADPVNQQRTITLALRAAGIDPSDVGLVHAHATSTILGDVNESHAIIGAIGSHPAVTSTKSMTGHLLGASGALGALATVKALELGIVPPTINLGRLDPGIDLDVVANSARPLTTTAAVVNSFGFGGHNASLVFTRD